MLFDGAGRDVTFERWMAGLPDKSPVNSTVAPLPAGRGKPPWLVRSPITC